MLKRDRKDKQIIEQLKIDPRMSLTTMSQRTGIPVSSIFDRLKIIRQKYKFCLTIEPRDEIKTYNVVMKGTKIYKATIQAESKDKAETIARDMQSYWWVEDIDLCQADIISITEED